MRRIVELCLSLLIGALIGLTPPTYYHATRPKATSPVLRDYTVRNADEDTEAALRLHRRYFAHQGNYTDIGGFDPSSNMHATIIRFVFTIGLPGDGDDYRFLGNVAALSPDMQTLKDMEIAPSKLISLHQLLYQHVPKIQVIQMNRPQPGLWNAHCEPNNTNADPGGVMTQLVELLQEIENMARLYYLQKGTSAPDVPISVPINTVRLADDNAGEGQQVESNFGEGSFYPSPRSVKNAHCHRLDFASMEIWYDACKQANVDCRHLYVHRPAQIEFQTAIESGQTTISNSDNQLAFLHLHNTMLQVMGDQMSRFSPRIIGCIGLGAQNNHHNMLQWQNTMHKMWGYASTQDLLDVAHKFPLHNVSVNPRFEHLQKHVSAEYEPFFESFLKLHEKTREECLRSLGESYR